ncbi:MAG: hypothetical protein NTX05_07945 [Fusobacteria bacterium]|nr:hypothetical protein [Fusobacteriota bacterium]
MFVLKRLYNFAIWLLVAFLVSTLSFAKVVTIEILALNDFHAYLAQDSSHPGLDVIATYIIKSDKQIQIQYYF